MRYLINELTVYDDNIKTLMNINYEEDAVKLAPGSVAILLEFLIRNPNVVWQKKEIGERAFSESLYSDSESNVNKSLSLLRRSFQDVGEDRKIISTLPSQGIVFNAKVREYDKDTYPHSMNVSRTKKNVKLCLFITGVVGLVGAALCIFLLKDLKRSDCASISRGSNEVFQKLSKDIEEIKECRAPGVVIDGATENTGGRKTYLLRAICEETAHSCTNFIEIE